MSISKTELISSLSSVASTCYKTSDGECAEPLSQGYCMKEEWLVKGSSGFLECQKRDCQPEEVMIDGECHEIDDTFRCNGSGMFKYVKHPSLLTVKFSLTNIKRRRWEYYTYPDY